MSNNVAFENFYETQLTSDISDTATDIFLDAVPTGDEGYLVIEPDVPANREVIYYTSKTASKVVCPSGAGNGRGYDQSTAISHLTGAKVIMAPVAAMFEDLKTLFTTTPQGWTSIATTPTVATGYNNGNRSFDLTFASDLSSTLSPGMRLKVDRDTTPGDQCADFESSSSQYASKSSPSGIDVITSTFTAEAWVKIESYKQMGIISRLNATDGWDMRLLSTGQVQITGRTTSSTQDDTVISYQSIPLNKWVHIAGALTMNTSGSTAIYIDGVSVPFDFVNGTDATIGVPAVNLEVGATIGADFFDGKMSEVRLWSDIRTATEIKDNMYNHLVGNESNLVAYFKLDGDFNDSTSNANNLTASGGAAATTDDHPFNTTEYAVVTNVSYSAPNTTVTIFCPEGYGIPNETLANPFYSTQSTPFGFPRDRGKWELFFPSSSTAALGIGTSMVCSSNLYNTIPVGSWRLSYSFSADSIRAGGSVTSLYGAIGTAASDAGAYPETIAWLASKAPSSPWYGAGTMQNSTEKTFTSATTLYMLDGGLHTSGNFVTTIGGTAGLGLHYLKAECAYI